MEITDTEDGVISNVTVVDAVAADVVVWVEKTSEK